MQRAIVSTGGRVAPQIWEMGKVFEDEIAKTPLSRPCCIVNNLHRANTITAEIRFHVADDKPLIKWQRTKLKLHHKCLPLPILCTRNHAPHLRSIVIHPREQRSLIARHKIVRRSHVLPRTRHQFLPIVRPQRIRRNPIPKIVLLGHIGKG